MKDSDLMMKFMKSYSLVGPPEFPRSNNWWKNSLMGKSQTVESTPTKPWYTVQLSKPVFWAEKRRLAAYCYSTSILWPWTSKLWEESWPSWSHETQSFQWRSGSFSPPPPIINPLWWSRYLRGRGQWRRITTSWGNLISMGSPQHRSRGQIEVTF